MRNTLVLALVVAATPVAHADDLTAGAFRGGTITRIDKTAWEDAEQGDRVQWTIELASPSETDRELVIPLAVPHDMAITSLRMVSTNDDVHLVSEVLEATEARTAYQLIVDSWSDPALLEWVSTTPKHDNLRLRVFPVSKGVTATITIEAKVSGILDADRAVTRERSLIARLRGVKPIMANAKNPRSLGDAFHERVPTLPAAPRSLAARAARPQRPLDRSLVEPVADQHQLRAARVGTPRVAVRQ